MIDDELGTDANGLAKIYCLTGKYLKAERSVLHTIKYRCFETGGSLLIGESGIGKTTFAKAFLDKHFEAPTTENDHKFGIYVEVPGGNLNELYKDILKELGDIDCEAGSATDKKGRVIKLINEMDVKVVFLDEIQTVLPSSGLLPTSKFVKDFKEIVNNTNCSWILCGTPEATAIKNVDRQLATRLPKTITLPVFAFKTEKQKLEYMEFLFDFLKHLPRGAPFFKCLNHSVVEDGFSYFNDINYNSILRLLLATRGCLRPFMHLMLDCVDRTPVGKKITQETFEEAYNDCFEGEELNPFRAPIGKVKTLLKERGLYA